MVGEEFSLAWKDFQNAAVSTFRNLRADENFTDVTLACGDGQQVKAHKVIIGACSSFFRNLLVQNPHNHPLIYLKGVGIDDLRTIMEFVYTGEVKVGSQQLNNFLETANDLRIEGLRQSIEHIESESIVGNESSAESTKILDDEVATFNLDSTISPIPFKDKSLAQQFDNVIDTDKQPRKRPIDEIQDDQNIPKKLFYNPVSENNFRFDILNDHSNQEPSFDELERMDEESIASSNQFSDQQKSESFVEETENQGINSELLRESPAHYMDEDSIISATIKSEENNQCSECNKVFTQKKNLQRHFKNLHEEDRVSCEHCEFNSTRQNLTRHVKRNHPGNNLVNDSLLNSPIKIEPLDIEMFKKKCDRCAFEGNFSRVVQQHRREKHEGQSFFCVYCSRQFANSNSLMTHVVAIHSGKKFSCHHCDHKATRKDHLMRHISRAHSVDQ
jgi:hypothetical protein